MESLNPEEREAISFLWSPTAIRERGEHFLRLAERDALPHFRLDLSALPAVVSRVVEVTRRRFPDLRVPDHGRWHGFSTGGIDRLAWLDARCAGLSPEERARTLIDLCVVSVLLDAGAGGRWRYREERTGQVLGRSEGVAVASITMFLEGRFSGDGSLCADAEGLARLNRTTLGAALQSRPDNPIVGLPGRVELMSRLGAVLEAAPLAFAGGRKPRVGSLFDHLCTFAPSGRLAAPHVLRSVLEVFGPIWPGRHTIGALPLGDVWHHDAAGGEGAAAGLVPFHELSQWLTYSLLQPLSQAGLEITRVDALTGLAGYRNGGLFIDLGVLVPRDPAAADVVHEPGSPLVVEWRALTVALLDRVADGVRAALDLETTTFGMSQVLEGGTWWTGRELAAERRGDGSPPLRVTGDGTIF